MVALIVCALALAAAVGAWLYERRHRRTHPMSGGLHPEITLPHDAEWELYHNTVSLCSRKLRLCLEELGLPWVSHPVALIETGAYENVGRAFLRVNPAGLVPVLVHQGHPVYESHEAIVYAAGHAGERGARLLGADPDTRAVVAHWTEVASLVGADPTRRRDRYAGNCIPGLTLPIFATMVERIPYRRIAEGLLFHPDRRRPLLFALLKWRGIGALPRLRPLARAVESSRDDMAVHLDALQAHLAASGGPWITGEAFTLADVSWTVLLDRLAEVDWAEYFWGDGRRPAVRAYFERLQARPSHAAAIEGYRDPLTRRGSARVREAKRSDPALRGALEGAASARAGRAGAHRIDG
jgi:glutathione S-transferase